MSAISVVQTRGAIENANKDFMLAFGKGDAAGVASLYSVNGQILPANFDIITGRGGIKDFWQAVMNMGIKAAKLETIEVEFQGEMAFEVGKYTLLGGNEQVLDTGKYVVIWKNDGSRWQLYRDIWTTSAPLPTA
jgi:ketosteroid isomerase-like protein